MGAHCIGGSIGIALLNGFNNGLVFGQGEFLPAPRIQKAAYAVQAKTSGFGEGLHPLETQGLKQHGMKFKIETVETDRIIRFDGGSLVTQILFQGSRWLPLKLRVMARTASTSMARRRNMFSRPSEILMRLTVVPRWGTTSTKASCCSLVKAS